MSWLFAKLYDSVIRPSETACLGAWRRELLAPLAGKVLELGAGTGGNVEHYPPAVDWLVLTEPDSEMRALLAERIRDRKHVELLSDPAERLSLPNGSVDAVVSTLVLCSVADPTVALREARRVLAPRGRLVFLEHVAANEGSSRLAWQKRVEPIWKRLAGNCHLTRDTAGAIRAAGFDIEWMRSESVRKALPFVRPSIRGTAVRCD